MSANIETMMYVGAVPWHHTGVYVGDNNVTSKEAIVKAGLDWEVGLAPGFYAHPETGKLIDGSRQGVVRLSDGALLGEVGARYKPVQNAEAFDFMDALVKDGEVRYHTAGALGGGERIWLLAQLPGELRIRKEDVTHPFVLLSNTHDGTGALRVLGTSVRVVCANTLGTALSQGKGDGISIRHDGDVMRKLGDARKALGLAKQDFDVFASFAQELDTIRFSLNEMRTMTEILIPLPPPQEGESDITDKVRANTEAKRRSLEDRFADGRGNDGETAWHALNAVTEFVDWQKGSFDRRTESAWFGSGAALKRKAVYLLDDALGLGYYGADNEDTAGQNIHVHVAA